MHSPRSNAYTPYVYLFIADASKVLCVGDYTIKNSKMILNLLHVRIHLQCIVLINDRKDSLKSVIKSMADDLRMFDVVEGMQHCTWKLHLYCLELSCYRFVVVFAIFFIYYFSGSFFF